MAEPKDAVVCVTGAAGFIGLHICKQLRERGYRVRGTVRSANDPKKTEHLKKFGVEIYEADLLEQGSYDDAVSGCTYVIHTASPYHMKTSNPQKQLIEPAVNGTINLLSSCLRAPSVKKVILTSSVAAITDDYLPVKVYTENDWNKKSSLKRNPYFYSKRLAEEAAWNYVYEHQGGIFDLVVINPTLVVGPAIAYTGEINISTWILQLICDGTIPFVVDLGFPFVDVRDVANAHILAMESPKANGRYIIHGDTVNMKEVTDAIRKKFPNHRIASVPLTGSKMTAFIKFLFWLYPSGITDYVRTSMGKYPQLETTKAEEDFGMTYMDMSTSLCDTMEDLIVKGYVQDYPREYRSKL